MKWVEVSPKKYRLVDDSDERPAIHLKSKPLPHSSGIHTLYVPPWKKYEEGMKHPDNKHQGIEADKFIAEREFQVKNDPKAKRWEESRKAAWAKDKPQWVKKMQQEGAL